MVECIRCGRQVLRIMKSTGTCQRCRDEEISLAIVVGIITSIICASTWILIN